MSQQALDRVFQQLVDQEQQAARDYTLVQQDAQRYQLQMNQLSDYRKQYLQQFTDRGEQGITGDTYAHYHNFMMRLEQAELEQKQALDNIRSAVQQKHQEWMAVRQKRDALELLLNNRKEAAAAREHKKEQKMLDEFANFQYFKKKHGR